MISFEELVLGGTLPIYLQIVAYVKAGIAAGTIQDGDEMPSRRVLSALLGVNPNTIQKAYRLLEEEGLICSHAGAKSYASVSEGQTAAIRRELLHGQVESMIEAMKNLGVTKDEAATLLDTLW